MKAKRLIAIFVMTIVAISVPATYQKGLEPRVKSRECSVEINSIRLNEEATDDNTVVFDAYLRITNFEKVDVILSKLDLDVYYRLEGQGYHDIGDLKTNNEYKIPAATDEENGLIESYYNRDNQLDYNVKAPSLGPNEQLLKTDYFGSATHVVANLSIIQEGQGSDSAVKDLVEGCLTLKLSGNAKAGAFEFSYQNTITIEENLWDPNFVIADVFNYYDTAAPTYSPVYTEGSNETDVNVLIVRAKMRNPSPIPMILKDYCFNLTYKDSDEVVAVGIPSTQLNKIYDPNYQANTRRSLGKVYLGNETSTRLPGIGATTGDQAEAAERWKDIIFVWNFTDPDFPYNPNNINSNTKDKINEFMNHLFSDPIINDYEMVGNFKLQIGSLSSDKFRGIEANIGYDNEFRMDDTRFYQFPDASIKKRIKIDGIEYKIGGKSFNEDDYEAAINYEKFPNVYDEPDENKKPISLKSLFSIGELQVEDIDINCSKDGYVSAKGRILEISNNKIRLNVSSNDINFDNLHGSNSYLKILNGTAIGNSYQILNSEEVIVKDENEIEVPYMNITLKGDPDLSEDGVSINNGFIIKYVPQDITMKIDSEITFENPYRLMFNITELATDYYRSPDLNDNNDPLYRDGSVAGDKTEEQLTYLFGKGKTTQSNPIMIDAAYVNNEDIDPSLINPKEDFNTSQMSLNHEITLKYNTLDYYDEGISQVLLDIGIDPSTINYSNPLWLLGPNGIKNEDTGNNLDEAELLKYLINNGIDPLMLLKNVNTSKIHYYGDNAYYPLKGSFFGNNASFDSDGRPISLQHTNVEEISKAFYYNDVGSISGGANNIYYPQRISDEFWDDSLEMDESDGTLRSQYDIFQRSDGGFWNLPGDWNIPQENSDMEGQMLGMITENLLLSDIGGYNLNNPEQIPSEDDVIWRIYGVDEEKYWGYFYDIEQYLHNFYMVHGRNTKDLLFSQHFRLNASIDPQENYNDYKLHSIDEIEKATLSVSFRYPEGTSGTYSPSAGFGLSYWDPSGKWISTGEFPLYTGSELKGWECIGTRDNTIDVDEAKTFDHWKHQSVDVTDIIKTAFENYEQAFRNGEPNAEDYLYLESQFGCKSGVVYFDDIVLDIEYKNERETPFRLKDLFKYIESNAPVEGNAYKFLQDTALDAVNMSAFMESDPPIEWQKGDGGDLSRYYQAADASIKEMIEIMTDHSKEIGAGESLSFLEMLNYSKYYIAPNEDSPNLVETEYGDRFVAHSDEEGWIIEDPYVASQQLVQSLMNEIYTNEYGQITQPNYYGKELWMMFENLGIDMSDICLYLFMNGWSKDDIFDTLEACGFGKMTKDNYMGEVQGLEAVIELRQEVDYDGLVKVAGIPFELNDVINMTYNNYDGEGGIEDNAIDESILKIYNYLCTDTIQAPPLYLIHNEGETSNQNPVNVGPIEDDFTFIITIRVSQEADLTVQEYEISVTLGETEGSYIAPDGVTDTNPYLDEINPGLNDPGSSLLTHYLRQTIEMNQAPFIEMNGDVIGLFFFLDKYFFTENVFNVPGISGSVNYDYSSYSLLREFDVSALDFVNIITGYNVEEGTFDDDGDGRADDWIAPQGEHENGGYGWYFDPEESLYQRPEDEQEVTTVDLAGSGGGWGNNSKKNRLYWDDDVYKNDRTNEETDYFGKIIWSDSPSLLMSGSTEISDYTVIDQGAPPIVNLIDMFLWLSYVDPEFNSELLFDWLLGESPALEYLTQNYQNNDYYISPFAVKRGLGLEKTWNWLTGSNFNVTGVQKWFRDVKGVDPFDFLYEMNTYNGIPGTGVPDPQSVLYFIRNPNYIEYNDGTKGFIEHSAIGATKSIAEDNFWNLFNGSWWNDQTNSSDYWNTNINTWTQTLPGSIFYEIIKLQESTGIDAFNIFRMLENLYIKPDNWINAIQDLGIKPLELLSIYDELDIEELLIAASLADKKTRLKINGSFHLNFFGMNLYDFLTHPDNELDYTIGPMDIYVSDHLQEFIDPEYFSAENGTFRIYS